LAILKISLSLHITAVTNKKVLQQNAVHYQQSISYWWRQSVSHKVKTGLHYSSLLFVDNKLTLICLLTEQQLAAVSVRYTQVILLIWQVLHL